MTRLRFFIFSVFVAMCASVFALSSGIPDKPNPPRLVNDFANILSASQQSVLEDSLFAFEKSTSTQIVVVTVDDLAGYAVSDFAYRIGEEWGVGQMGKNNGAVIVVKIKTERSNGQAFIATGYGLEGSLPDIKCGRIVRDEMIPHFRAGDYEKGLLMGVRSVMRAVRGEYTADNNDDQDNSGLGMAILILVAVVVIVIIMKENRKQGGRITSSGKVFTPHITFGGGNSHYGDRYTNTSRSSGFGRGGGFGGGFGGFGGGRFGGGGGGGSW